MAKPKKGTLHQLLVPMVDSTDFASIESAITASDFNSGVTAKFYGLNTGGSAATTSGTISKTASLVRSGVFRITLKTTENNYDYMMCRFNKTGCAEQIIVWENVDNDDSDILSAITIGNSRVLLVLSNVSDVQSALTVVQSMASDAASAAAQGNSRVLLVQSRLSDLDSRLASDTSDILSGVTQANSRLLVNQSVVSDLYSQVSDFRSNLLSLLNTTGIKVSASDMSDLRSAITATTAAVSASDMSDIASRVGVLLASDLSDILSAAVQTNSRVILIQSRLSDLDSRLSDFQSDLNSFLTTTGVKVSASDMSDLRSAITATTAAVSASDMSDIASRVRVLFDSDLSDILSAAVQANSRVLLVQSRLSDLDSRLVSDVSDIRSAIAAITVTLTASDISDIASATAAAVTFSISASDMSDIASRVDVVLASRLSDILSAAQQANSRVILVQSRLSDLDSRLASDTSDILSAATQVNSRVLLNQSRISDIYSLLSDLHSDVGVISGIISDVYSALGAGVGLSASDISDLRSAITANGVLRAGAEPTTVIGHTDTAMAKIDWLAALARNKVTETATLQSLRNDADNSTIASAVVSDDGTTFTRGEFAS